MGKKNLTVRKRRKDERKVAENNQISHKRIHCPPIFHKCGDEQQSTKSNYSYTDSQQFISSSKPCDENSKQRDDQNSEQWDDKNSGHYQKWFNKRFAEFNAVIKRVSFSYEHNRCGIISY